MRFIGLAIALFLTLPGTALADEPPTVTLDAPGAEFVSGPVDVTANASDDAGVARVEFRVRGVLKFTDRSAPYTGTFLSGSVPDGPAKITATAFDDAGQSASAAVDVTIDNAKPALTVSGPDKQRFLPGSTQSWSFGATDAGAGIAQIRCSVQPMNTPPAFGPCTSPGDFVLSGQPEGTWTFSVRATDGAGNFAQQGRDFKIDGTAPETTIASGIGDGATTTETALTWALEASESASFECRVVPEAFAPCSGPAAHTVTGLTPGVYTFEARASDLAGNVDATPARRTFTVAAAASPAAAAPPFAQAAAVRPPQIEVALSFRFSATRRATRLANFLVRNVPPGATVTVTCPKGCARKSFRRTNVSGRLLLKPVLRKLLPVGTEITVIVSKPGAGSAVKVLTIRARKAPLVRTLCRPEGSSKPAAC